MSYQYILRFTVQPGFHEDDRLEKLVAFCKEARIDDVTFFINGEELNTGHLTIEETTPWLRDDCQRQKTASRARCNHLGKSVAVTARS